MQQNEKRLRIQCEMPRTRILNTMVYKIAANPTRRQCGTFSQIETEELSSCSRVARIQLHDDNRSEIEENHLKVLNYLCNPIQLSDWYRQREGGFYKISQS